MFLILTPLIKELLKLNMFLILIPLIKELLKLNIFLILTPLIKELLKSNMFLILTPLIKELLKIQKCLYDVTYKVCIPLILMRKIKTRVAPRSQSRILLWHKFDFFID